MLIKHNTMDAKNLGRRGGGRGVIFICKKNICGAFHKIKFAFKRVFKSLFSHEGQNFTRKRHKFILETFARRCCELK